MTKKIQQLATKSWIFLKSQKGQNMVEYGLLLALITLIVIGLIFVVGDSLIPLFERIKDTIAAGTGTSS